MGNTRNTGFLQNAVKVADNGDISLMHGNTMLMQISASGAITTTGVISGSNALSASYAVNATTASFASSATSASYALNATTASYALSATSASFTIQAQTASSADAFTVRNTLTAQTLVVQTITSSVDFVTGSTRFGSLLDNTHVFTGSVNITGSTNLVGALKVNKIGINTGDINLDNHSSNLIVSGTIGFANSSGGTAALVDRDGSGNTTFYGNTGDIRFIDATFTSNYLTIKSAGNVGIGTASPTGTYGKLTVAGGIQITNDNNAKLEIGRYSSGAPNSYIKIGSGSDSLRITNAADSADLFTITNDGKILINATTSSFGNRLIVNDAALATGSNGGWFFLDRSNSANQFGWYSTNNAANLWNGSINILSATAAGKLNLGNGSYSPYLTFNTGGSTSYAGVINMDSKIDYLAFSGGSTTGYGSGAYMYMYGSDRYGTNTAGMLTLGAGNSTNNSNYGYISFDTANTERMRINSSGYITTPYNPAFRAYSTTNGFVTLSTGNVFPFNATEYNIGSCYNTSTYRFTAPVAGLYKFDFYSIVYGAYTDAAISFNINAGNPTSGFNMHFSPTSTTWSNIVYTTSIYLNSGDYVFMKNTGGSVSYHGLSWSSFSGYLVG
jgi:hypothetical protein